MTLKTASEAVFSVVYDDGPSVLTLKTMKEAGLNLNIQDDTVTLLGRAHWWARWQRLKLRNWQLS